jgi:hypothetical protein
MTREPRKQSDHDLRGDAQVVQRRDDALRRALNTPPKHHKDMKKGKGKKQPDQPTASSEKRDQRSRTP